MIDEQREKKTCGARGHTKGSLPKSLVSVPPLRPPYEEHFKFSFLNTSLVWPGDSYLQERGAPSPLYQTTIRKNKEFLNGSRGASLETCLISPGGGTKNLALTVEHPPQGSAIRFPPRKASKVLISSLPQLPISLGGEGASIEPLFFLVFLFQPREGSDGRNSRLKS